MKKRDHHLLQGWVYAITALFILSVPFWADMSSNEYGAPMAIAIALVIGFLSFREFKKRDTTDEKQMVYAPSADATVSEQRSYYKKFIQVSVIAFPALTWLIVSDLNSLDDGTSVEVRIWAPVAFLYAHFGYWCAVLAVPILGIIVLTVFSWKIQSLKRTNSTS
jgi:hypothetical protein